MRHTHAHRLTHVLISIGAALGLLLAAPVAAAAPAGPQFTAMDANHDGKLTLAEHAAGARQMFTRMDANRDGRVTATEMDAAQAAMNPGQPVSKSITSAGKIAAIDRNADGVLTADEHAAGSQEMFTTMDTDRDGLLSADELRIGHERLLERSTR